MNVKVELDLSNYATKADLKGAAGIRPSTLSSTTDLRGLKTKVNDLDIDKLKTVPTDSSKLIVVVDNDVINRACIINCLPKLMLLILRHQVLVD